MILHNGILSPDCVDALLPTAWSYRSSFQTLPQTPNYLKERPDVIPIDCGRQLFVDDFLIEESSLHREFYSPEIKGMVLTPETVLEMDHGNCPVTPLLLKLQGKWKTQILYELCIHDTVRFGQLQKALENPGSDLDLVLREDDRLVVPQYVNTVKINGTVMFPNTVLYEKGENLKHYINQAGGYGQRAQKNKVYVVYMNGTVARIKGGSKKAIKPGCEIIVPEKPEKKGMSLGEIIGLSSSIASLGAIVATLVTLTR